MIAFTAIHDKLPFNICMFVLILWMSSTFVFALAPANSFITQEIILLTEEEVAYYIGENSVKTGQMIYMRRLHPKEDLHFLNEWKLEHDADEEWRNRWQLGKELYEDFPRFGYFEELSFGIFTLESGREKLQGFVGLGLEINGINFSGGEKIYSYLVNLPQMELYYKNIGKDRHLPGLADLLLDQTLKFSREMENMKEVNFVFYPVTPGAIEFGHRRRFVYRDDRHFWMDDKSSAIMYLTRGLERYFNQRAFLSSSKNGEISIIQKSA